LLAGLSGIRREVIFTHFSFSRSPYVPAGILYAETILDEVCP
jgi:hypothetical protein